MIIKKFYYRCTDCGTEYDSESIQYLCPICKTKNTTDKPPRGVLKTLYNYENIKKQNTKQELISKIEKFDYSDVMPIENSANYPQLKVGQTPVYKINSVDNQKFSNEIYIKDDSQNPTYSFKDRASYLVSAFAKERSIDTIIAASTGNAGSSLAGICASQNQKAVIFLPATAPKAKLTQIVMYGAKIIPVEGNYDSAFDLSISVSEKFGYYNRNTAFNPLTIEGKKTVSFEIFSEFKDKLPDKIFVPVGDGAIIAGVYKGFEDLLMLGLIDKIPEIIAVQAETSSNLIDNLNRNDFQFVPATTKADSISVDIPRNFYMAVQFLKKYEGKTIKVSDDEITDASLILSRNTGIFSEPAATAAFAGMLKLKQNKENISKEKWLILLTGSGLKDLNAVQSKINIPQPVKLNLEAVQKLL
jgi:threonine synthase